MRKNRANFFSEPHGLPFCPVPAPADLPDAPPDVLDFLRHELKNYDVEKPVIFVVMQLEGRRPMTEMQATKFLCGFHRLNIANQLMIFALSENSATQELLHRRHPELRVLWHAGLVEIVAQAGRRTNIPPNRVCKLVIANLLVHLDRQVIVADVDE